MADASETVSKDEANYETTTEDAVIKSWNLSNSDAAHNTPIIDLSTIIYIGGVVAFGAVGFLANGLVFMLQFFNRTSSKSACSALIHNQTAIDFVTSVLLLITYAVYIDGIHRTETCGRLQCKFINSNALYSFGVNGSVAGLTVITVERYAKIVHSILYRVRYRPWMKCVALVLPWIYSAVLTFPSLMATSDLSNGKCLVVSFWPAKWLKTAYVVTKILFKFILPLTIFVFCYTKILTVMKSRSKVHASRNANVGNSLMTQSEKNIIKTLLFVVGCYVLAYAPYYIYYALSVAGMKCCYLESEIYHLTIFISYLNIVVNPFIYATKSKTVNEHIRRICKKIHHKKQTSSVVPFTVDT